MERILIIEDDVSIAELQKDYLEMSGYEVTCCGDGESGMKTLQEGGYDLVILDLMLPGKDGFAILREMAQDKEIPVLIVSAREEQYKIKGLNLGADDYITKPFSMGELVARVKSHLKTYDRLKKKETKKVITVRSLRIDCEDRRVFVGDTEVTLKQKEYELLLYFIQNPNRVLSREQLYERVWGFDAFSDVTTVTVHIARIREKIEENPAKPQYIETVWGAGYRFRM